MSYQKLTVVGNIGQDFRQENVNGRYVINGSVAVSKNWVDKNGTKQTKTTWFSVSQWRDKDMSNFIKYLIKGTQVLVVGEVVARTYQNQQNQTVAQLQIDADEIKLLSSNNNQSNQPPPPQQNNNSQSVEEIKDLPF